MLKYITLGSSRASSPTHTKSNTLELTSGANHHDNQHQQPHHNGTYLLLFKHVINLVVNYINGYDARKLFNTLLRR